MRTAPDISVLSEKVLTNGKRSAVMDIIEDDSHPLADTSHDENNLCYARADWLKNVSRDRTFHYLVSRVLSLKR